MRLLGPTVSTRLALQKTPPDFSGMAVPFTFPPARDEKSSFSASSPAFGAFRHSDRRGATLGVVWTRVSLTTNSHVPIHHPDLLLGNIPVRVSCPVSNRAFFLQASVPSVPARCMVNQHALPICSLTLRPPHRSSWSRTW